MIQFSGREEELIETLRAMQEKSIAQRAMAAVQRSAKKEAGSKRSIVDDSSEDPSSVKDSSFASIKDSSMASSVERNSITNEFADDDDDSYSSGSSGSSSVSSFISGSSRSSGSSSDSRSEGSSRYTSYSESDDQTGTIYSQSQSEYSKDVVPKVQPNIQAAIDASDWRAVGDSAAILLGENDAASGTNTDPSNYTNMSREEQDDMDKMIDEGNWSGIIEKSSSNGSST